MQTTSIKIRWIGTTTFEVVLPNGKVALFDPWLGVDPVIGLDMGLETKLEDITGADYMFISHAHGDHCAATQVINERFMEGTNGGRIFLPGVSSLKLARKYQIPFRDIVPVFPNETFELDGMSITALPCRHRGDPISPNQDHEKMRRRNPDISDEDLDLMDWGNLEEIDWAVSVKDLNFRFMVLGGGLYHFQNTPRFCDNFQPTLVIRQVSNILAKDPVTYAKMCDSYHASFVFPSHHDLGIHKSYKEYSPFFAQVNEELEKMGSRTRLIDIERGKWYTLGSFIE